MLRPQGIQGLVRVRPDTETPERFLEFDSLLVRQGANVREVPAEEVSVRDGFVYLRLDGADTRDKAEAQRGWILLIDRARARRLRQDEWFICDLVGCRVEGDKGADIGELTDVMVTGPNPVLVIRDKKGRTILVAMMRFVIDRVDIPGRLVVLREERLPEVAVYE